MLCVDFVEQPKRRRMDTLSPLLLCGHAILYRLNPVYTFPQGINSSFIPTMNTRWTRPQAQRSEKTRKEKPESLVHIWFGLTGISAILLLLLCCVFNTTRITDSLSCLSSSTGLSCPYPCRCELPLILRLRNPAFCYASNYTFLSSIAH